MDRFMRCEVGSRAAVALVLVIAVLGCTCRQDKTNGRKFKLATVERLQPAPRQVKQVLDPEKIEKLASFFPGLDRRWFWGSATLSISGVRVTFTRTDGSTLEVVVTPDLDEWACGRGGFPVEGDLAGFLRELFPEAPAE